MLEFESIVTNGRLEPAVAGSIAGALAKAEGKWVKIALSMRRRRRTLNQNSFFHGPFLDAATWMFNESGNTLDREEVKSMLKEMFGLKVRVKMPDGLERIIPKSTKEYTTIEIEDLMQKIRAWAAQYNQELPIPNEHT